MRQNLSGRLNFISSLERTFTRSQRKKGRSDPSELEEIFNNHRETAANMGPVLGLLSFIYGMELPA